MKTLKTLFAVLAVAAAVQVQAAGLDKFDQGDYVLLNMQQEPTPMQMRFVLQGRQWMMDGKEGNGSWQPVCRADGQCRLQASSTADMKKWRQRLPQEVRNFPLACINNVALAFCRSSKPDNPDMRLYWWIPLVGGQDVALGLNRLR